MPESIPDEIIDDDVFERIAIEISDFEESVLEVHSEESSTIA
jgi:hypothetical protein